MHYRARLSSPRIARPSGLEGVEVHTGEDSGTHPRRIFADYTFLLAGESSQAVVQARNREVEVSGPALVMVEPESVISISVEQSYTYHALFIAPPTLRGLFSAAPAGHRGTICLPRLLSRSSTVIRSFEHMHHSLGTARTAAEAQTALLQLLFTLLGGDLLKRLPAPETHPAVISRARELIRASYTHGITLDELSSRIGMCKYALVRAFSREFGLPPHAYQTYLRVARARALILEGRSISDTALDVGFADQSHLNRHFKQVMGYTPGAYAKQVRAGKPRRRRSRKPV